MRPETSMPASYAVDVARLLWPDPWGAPEITRRRHRPALGSRDAYIFPSRRQPRVLVPADVPDSANMLRRLGSGHSALAAPARSILVRSVRSWAFPLARWPMLQVRGADPAADSIERALAECVGTDVRVGVLLGTRRVNQKPVLQVFRLDGAVLGYAKLGHNELTTSLVRGEADALTRIGALLPRSFRVPQVLHHTRWSGLEVLVISALATTGEPVTHCARISATREISGLTGTTSRPLAESDYWSRRRAAIARLEETPDSIRVAALARAVDERHGADVLTWGGWHGDWGAWNMGMGETALQIWDWERYDAEVPIGFDALHFAAQAVRPVRRDRRRQEAAFLDAVPHLLDELGVRAPRREPTLHLYLLEMALRYTDAQRHGATPALQCRTAWVLSLLERQLGTPTTGTPKGRS